MFFKGCLLFGTTMTATVARCYFKIEGCHCALCKTEVQECPCESQNQVNFSKILFISLASGSKRRGNLHALQSGSKIDIYCCKNRIFLALRAGPPTSGHGTTVRVPLVGAGALHIYVISALLFVPASQVLFMPPILLVVSLNQDGRQ